jgi:hypothetical protein
MPRTLTAIRTLCLAAVAATLLSAPATADAYWPYVGYGFGGPWNYGHAFNAGAGYVPPPPYYSVFPPVYYSPHIQARHYGASPFAWYPGMEPIRYVDVYPAAPAAMPVMIENPYVEGAGPNAADQASTDGKPLRLDNPYVARAQ